MPASTDPTYTGGTPGGPDAAAVGGSLMTKPAPVVSPTPPADFSAATAPTTTGVTSSSAASNAANQAYQSVVNTGQFFTDAQARAYWDAHSGDATGFIKSSDGSGYYVNPGDLAGSGTPGATDMFDAQNKLNLQAYNDTVANTQEMTNYNVGIAQESQRQESGAANAMLARIGALGTTTAGMSYLNDLNDRHVRDINHLVAQGQSAIQQASLAKTDADLKVLSAKQASVEAARQAIQQQTNDYYTNLQKFYDIQKLQSDSVSGTIDNIASSGMSPDQLPNGYLDSLDSENNLPKGTSAGMYALALHNRDVKTQTDAITAASSLQNLLGKMPAGMPLTLDGHTYFGTDTGTLQVDNATGNGYIMTQDPTTGQFKAQSVGFVGAKKDGFSLSFDNQGRPWSFNTQTGQLNYVGGTQGTNSANIAQSLPDGSYGGQCGEFVRTVAGVRVGNSLQDKESAMDPTLGTAQKPLKIGDVVVESVGGWTGHVAVINAINRAPNGMTTFTLSESNFSGDQKVSNTRQISENDPAIKGFISGNLNPALQSGTDAPVFASSANASSVEVIDTSQGLMSVDKATGVATPVSVSGIGGPSPVAKADNFIVNNTVVARTLGADGKYAYSTVYTPPAGPNGANVTLEDTTGGIMAVDKTTGVATPIKLAGASGSSVQGSPVQGNSPAAPGVLHKVGSPYALTTPDANDPTFKDLVNRFAAAEDDSARSSVLAQAKTLGIDANAVSDAAQKVPVPAGQVISTTTGRPVKVDKVLSDAVSIPQEIREQIVPSMAQSIGYMLDDSGTPKKMDNTTPDFSGGFTEGWKMKHVPPSLWTNGETSFMATVDHFKTLYTKVIAGARPTEIIQKSLKDALPSPDVSNEQNAIRIKEFMQLSQSAINTALKNQGLKISTGQAAPDGMIRISRNGHNGSVKLEDFNPKTDTKL